MPMLKIKHDYIDELKLDQACLQAKKEQTTKKIEYIRSYVEQWLYVWVKQDSTKSVTFIDAMCNAGIYEDGDLGTSVEVWRLFVRFAKQYPSVRFNLYVNDYDKARVDTCVKLCMHFGENSKSNIRVVYANLDVNDFLEEAATTDKVPAGPGNAVLLFVDPYNARTVHLGKMSQFIQSRYCEVLFNWFSSDLNRNKEDKAILDCFDGLEVPQNNDAVHVIGEALRVGSMRYVFSYPFHNQNNTELYQIIFVTPKSKGLEKLKNALWATFHGEEHHRNLSQRKREELLTQQQLFSIEDLDDMRASDYAGGAKRLVLESFDGQEHVPFERISTLLLERTMLRDGQFLKYVIKPLVADGKIIKDGLKGKANFKEDTYSFTAQRTPLTL